MENNTINAGSLDDTLESFGEGMVVDFWTNSFGFDSLQTLRKELQFMKNVETVNFTSFIL